MTNTRDTQDTLYLQLPDFVEQGKHGCWLNPALVPYESIKNNLELADRDIQDAADRMERFAPLIAALFPETATKGGIIESELSEAKNLKMRLETTYGISIQGRLFLKKDNELPIAGSVKARGGIYEILKYTEDLAVAHGLLSPCDSYAKLCEPACRQFFSQYTIQVGSTGNLGLSIGRIRSALGFHTVVHMSEDAKEWKKQLLRSHGVTVKEYNGSYTMAVEEGRRKAAESKWNYFVDDESSRTLFLGYAVAAHRLKKQLEDLQIVVDAAHPLFLYLPCGVGGAPGGITFGAKQLWGDYVHCFFVEPTQAPCMLLGLMTGRHNQVSVQDIGLSGKTCADGLAVGTPSSFVGRFIAPMVSGCVTVEDRKLFDYLRDVLDTEGTFLEPSAAAGVQGLLDLCGNLAMKQYWNRYGLRQHAANSTHIIWATGGKLVPEKARAEYLSKC